MYTCKHRHTYYILTLRVFFQGFVIHTALENSVMSSNKMRYGIFNLVYTKKTSLCRIYRKSYSLSFQGCGACCHYLGFPSRDFCVASSVHYLLTRKTEAVADQDILPAKWGQNNGFNLTCTRNQVIFLVCLMLQFLMTGKLKGFLRLTSSFLNYPSGDWPQRHLTPVFAAAYSPACFIARLLVNLQIIFDISL